MKRLLSILCVLCLLATAIPFAATASTLPTTTYDFDDLQGYYKTQGRVEVTDVGALDMDTSSSGFELYFYGKGDVTINADIHCRYTTDMFFSVIVDGTLTRVKVDTGTTENAVNKTLTLASGLVEGYHHIELYKQTEASSAFVTVWGITLTGNLLTTPDDKITMEVVGDSISGGASSLYDGSNLDASYPVFQDGTQTYAYLAGEALGANVRVTQTSGYGCVGGWNMNTDVNLQVMYPYTSYWRDHSETGYYDFNPAADIVVINLGTNDYTVDYNTTHNSNPNDDVVITSADFKAGAKNLMTMAQTKNPGAKVVWCTGMMGTFYATEMKEAVSELGGAASGFYFCELPYGVSGGAGHPNVAEHQAAATVLENFLLENCLPDNYKSDFATAAQLQATYNAACAVANPSVALTQAIAIAQAELNFGTTDPYRLGCRKAALETAMSGVTVGLDLMPQEGVTTAPTTNDDDWVWVSYSGDHVTMYKGGEDFWYPYVHTEYLQVVDLSATPYLTVDLVATASWNIHIAYIDKDGARQTITASAAAGNGDVDFTATERKKVTIDLGSYINSLGTADSLGRIRIVGCDIYVVGASYAADDIEDPYVQLYTCAITDDDGLDLPSAITSDTHTVAGGVVSDINEGVTVADLIASTNDSDYLQVVGADGEVIADTTALATGMTLQLVSPNGTVIDEAVVAVMGDYNGDGEGTTNDAREILKLALYGESYGASAAQKAASDMNKDTVINTSDVRVLLRAIVTKS